MPGTLVQRRTNQSAVAVSSLTGTWSPAPVQGNLLVINGDSDATLTMTSSGFSLAIASVNDVGLYQWWKIAGASESTSVVLTPSGSASTEIVMEEWSGMAASSPLDKTASGSAAGGSLTIPSGTTAALAQADELGVAAFGWNDSGGAASGSSYTNSYVEVADIKGLGGMATNVSVAELALSSTAATSSTATLSFNPGSVKSGLIGTYKAAAAADAPPPNLVMAPYQGAF